MMMPALGSRSIRTSQNIRPVVAPSPSTVGQFTIASSILGGTVGRRAGGRLVCVVCADIET
jgi:hypothetical protein